MCYYEPRYGTRFTVKRENKAAEESTRALISVTLNNTDILKTPFLSRVRLLILFPFYLALSTILSVPLRPHDFSIEYSDARIPDYWTQMPHRTRQETQITWNVFETALLQSPDSQIRSKPRYEYIIYNEYIMKKLEIKISLEI